MSRPRAPVTVPLFLALLWGATQGHAAALPRGEGNWFLSLDLRYQAADRYWDMSGDRRDLKLDFSKLELTLYAEYGWDASNTLVFKGAYARAEQGPFDNDGVSALEAGLIHNLQADLPGAFSIYGKIVFPNGQSPASHYPLVDYDEYALEGGVLYGSYHEAWFLDSALGWREYLGYPSDQVRGYLTLGRNLGATGYQGISSLWLTYGTDPDAEGPKLDSTLSNAVNTAFTGSPGVVSVQPYYRLLELNLLLRVPLGGDAWLTPNVTLPLWGRNTGLGYSAGIGVWLAL